MKLWHLLLAGGVAYLLFAKKGKASTTGSSVPAPATNKLTPEQQAEDDAERKRQYDEAQRNEW